MRLGRGWLNEEEPNVFRFLFLVSVSRAGLDRVRVPSWDNEQAVVPHRPQSRGHVSSLAPSPSPAVPTAASPPALRAQGPLLGDRPRLSGPGMHILVRHCVAASTVRRDHTPFSYAIFAFTRLPSPWSPSPLEFQLHHCNFI